MLGIPQLRLGAALAALVVLGSACGSGGDQGGTGGSAGTTTTTTSSAGSTGGGPAARGEDPAITKNLDGRAYEVKAPADLDATKAAPLLVMLHGFSSSPTAPQDMDSYMRMSLEANKRGIIVALPRGTHDTVIDKYEWNATDSCCGFDTPDANDIGYLAAMIDEITAKYKIDAKRLYIVGHSNGGFMAHRLACDEADKFAAIVSLAGGTFKNQKKCAASAPISVLQVHGDADGTISYTGGPPLGVAQLPPAPGAVETMADWAVKNRCGKTPDTSAPAVDLVTNLAGAETTKAIYPDCEAGVATELWTIHGGPHSPAFSAAWAPAVLDFLMAHPKP
jgi:polyhydroxybutyrate depolymerase